MSFYSGWLLGWITALFALFLLGICLRERRPRIVCICGSSRFWDTWQQAEFDETMMGNIYLSLGFFPHAKPGEHGEGVGITPEQKVQLDELHKRKIDLADEVLVLNVGGYIGESTSSEIRYAQRKGKPVRYLEGGDL